MTELPEEFKKYIELSEKIEDLESQKRELKSKMIDIFDDYNTNELLFTEGSFVRRSRTTYQYSDSMRMMEKRVKQLKKQEEFSGTAVIKSSTQYVAFRPRK